MVTDCDYITWTGYKDSDDESCSDSDNGEYYSVSMVTECAAPVGYNMSGYYTCGDDGEMAVDFFATDDCSGDVVRTDVSDSCLTADDCTSTNATDSSSDSDSTDDFDSTDDSDSTDGALEMT